MYCMSFDGKAWPTLEFIKQSSLKCCSLSVNTGLSTFNKQIDYSSSKLTYTVTGLVFPINQQEPVCIITPKGWSDSD